MPVEKKRLLIAALIIGAFAAALFALYARQLEENQNEREGEQVSVMVAAHEITASSTLTKNHVNFRRVPVNHLAPTAIREENAGIYYGSKLRAPVKAGQMILSSDFAFEAARRSLATSIPIQERAFTMPVTETSGLAGMIEPGNRVDIVYTVPLDTRDESFEEGGRRVSGFVTLTLLQNVTVLAAGSRRSHTQNDRRNAGYDTITLALTQSEVELLTIAQTRGNLTYSLRHPDDFENLEMRKVSLKDTLVNDLDLIDIQKKRHKRWRKKKEIEVMAGDRP